MKKIRIVGIDHENQGLVVFGNLLVVLGVLLTMSACTADVDHYAMWTCAITGILVAAVGVVFWIAYAIAETTYY